MNDPENQMHAPEKLKTQIHGAVPQARTLEFIKFWKKIYIKYAKACQGQRDYLEESQLTFNI